MSLAEGIDAAWRVPAKDVARAGRRFALGYLFNGYNDAGCLTRAHVADYTDRGLGLGSLWEVQASEVAEGERTGLSHGRCAVEGARNLAQPKHSTITAACDQDPASLPGGPAGAVAYYRGFARAVREAGFLVMGYIGAAGANACLDAGVIDRVMIPNASAWADGARPRRVDVLQGYPYVTVGGAEVDPDRANLQTAGLWNGHGLFPRETPPPDAWRSAEVPVLMQGERNEAVKLLQRGLHELGYFHSLFDSGDYGPETVAGVRRFKADHNIPGGEEMFGEVAWNVLFRELRQR